MSCERCGAQLAEREPLPFAQIAYDYNGAAAAVGLSSEVLRQAVNRGDLIPHYLGRKPVFRAVDLDAWVRTLPTESSSDRRRSGR